MFLWRACRDCLPTRSKLQSKAFQFLCLVMFVVWMLRILGTFFVNCSFAQNCWKNVNLYDMLAVKERLNETILADNIRVNAYGLWDGSTFVWQKPPTLFLKCNIDTAIFKEHKSVGFGMVTRNEKGDFVISRTSTMPCLMKAKAAESCGLLEALEWINSLSFH
ncbi:hypothetical protein DITRI_Ditri09bG0073700 [Diplodiscus trichospermus]